VRAIIRNELSGDALPEAIRPVLGHIAAAEGKMIRPALVLLAGLACGKMTQKHVHVATIMEMLHQATLLHDDVLDQARTRRGMPAANRIWGDTAAILAGDLVLSRVMACCAGLGSKTSSEIAAMAGQICRGELHQVLRRGHWQITQQEYLQFIQDKSAVFFAICCRLGATLSGARQGYVKALESYGLLVGMAFQISDDLQDLLSGPQPCHDLATGTVTLPIIHMLEIADAGTRRQWTKRLDSGTYRPNELAKALVDHGSVAYTNQVIKGYLDQALRYLDAIRPSRPRQYLTSLAHYCAGPRS